MAQNPLVYQVFPAVVPADKESEITVVSHDGPYRFYDDLTYEIQFWPLDESDTPCDEEISRVGYANNKITYYAKPVNGEIKIKYFFKGEQEWRIHVSCQEYDKYCMSTWSNHVPKWNYLINYPKKGIDVNVYSLYPDLYERRALSGDLHIHTINSDGSETPELVAASYRKAGRDFISITDHHLYNTSKNAEKLFSFVKNFKVMPGEEIHNGYAGLFHMVNVNSKYSVNDVYLNEKERVDREIEELKNEIEVPENLDAHEYVSRVWLYREIKKSGGYAIFPHPYWNIGYYHTSKAMSKAIMKNGLCDAFELIGGNPPKNNNLQLALWTDLLSEGVDIPIVASTDSHSAQYGDHLKAFTVAFTKGDNVIEAISEGYTTAVEMPKGESARVYGKSRLVLYTHFLLDNYFPLHNELCSVSGIYMSQYAHGKTDLKPLIEDAEKQVEKFEKAYFNR